MREVTDACGESANVDYDEWCPIDPVTSECAGPSGVSDDQTEPTELEKRKADERERGPAMRSGEACYSRDTIQQIMTKRTRPGYNKDPLTRHVYTTDERAMLGLGPDVPLTTIEVMAQLGYIDDEDEDGASTVPSMLF